GSSTEAQPGSLPALEVFDDAGSTPAVGAAFNPGDVHPVTGKTVEAVFTGANGAREIAYTDGTSETIAPTPPQPSNQTDVRGGLDTSDPAQDAAAEAALANGPKSLMDVATRAGKVNPGRLQFSLSPAERHRQIAAQQGFRRGQAATATDPAEIVASYQLSPDEATVTRTDIPPNTPTAQDVRAYWTVTNKQGGVSYIVHAADNTVFINSQDQRSKTPQPAEGGDLVYQAALTYAHNKGLTFRADAESVSDIAQGRRVSHMLASALRHQSTAHIDPSRGRDRLGKPKHEVPGWRHDNTPEATEHNINLLAKEEYRHVFTVLDNAGIDITRLRWNAANDTVWDDSSKKWLSTQRFNQIVGQLDPGRTGVGETTLSRALVTQAAIRESQSGGSGSKSARANSLQRGRPNPLQQGDSPARLLKNKLYYSIRPVDGPRLSERVENTRAVAQQAARILNQQLPGIVGPKLTFFASPAELLASNYAAENSFTPAEIAQMQDAEAFYDNDTGHTIVFTDAIEVRPGESERAAVARVILHERVGHDGFNVLHQNDAQFRERWNSISKDIPSAEMDAIARDYPHLAGDKHQLALEWFARAVEQRLHLKEGNLARRLWLAFKAFVQRLRDGFANTEAWVHEDALKELITKAREAAQKGTAVPTTAEGLRHRLQFTEGTPARDDMDLGEAIENIEAFYADPVETDYWPTDLAKKWEDDPLRVAVEDAGDFLAAVPHLPEALRNSPQVQAWAAAYQRWDELQRKRIKSPLTEAEIDESDALEEPTNDALDWLDSPDVQSAMASRKSALETTVEARAAQTIQQIESTGRYKWNRKSKSFDYVDDSDIRVQFSLASQPVPADSPAGLLEYDYRDESSLSEPERRALAGVRREYGRDVQPVSPRAARPDYRLTPRQAQTRDREGADIAEAFKVVFFKTFLFVDGPGSLHGASADNSRNVLIVNLHSEQPLLWIAGHELTHSLAAQQPELYAELKRAVLAQARDWSDYRAKRLANGYPEAEIADEFVADFVGAQFLEPGFMNRLAQEQPSLFARLAAAIKRFLDAVLGRAAKLDRDVRPYFQDLTALRDQLASTLGEYSQRGQFPDNPLQGTGKLNKALGGSRVFHDK
ncbi:MAG: hypothetical protein ACOYMN_16695, partial [Roseimicrobium sp.]